MFSAIRGRIRRALRAVSGAAGFIVGLIDDARSAHVYTGIAIASAGLYGALNWWASAIFAGLTLIWLGTRTWA